jgi:BirA family biotin operon repressor/biotin-[acetyl-CoA-carboxylase] ligase
MLQQLLVLLRQHNDPASGEALGRTLGVSRVAVWKHVKELRSLGYDIVASSRGYSLLSSPDLLLPGEFPGWEDRVHHFNEVDSTMRVARELARKGAPQGTLIAAEIQTGGRGRLDRAWVSPPGGVYVTVVTRPSAVVVMAPRINLVASVAVSTAVEQLLGIPARVKWPNDVLVHGKKLCGILAEMEAELDAVRFVNVGIGLNANSRVSRLNVGAVSLMELLGHPIDRKAIARAVIEGILVRLPSLDKPQILDEWRDRAYTLGREVVIAGRDEVVEGIAIDIDDFGALIVRRPDGSVTSVVAGDCVHKVD